MTISSSQSWDLVQIAKDVNRELLIGFSWNYMPIVQQAFVQLQKRVLADLSK